MMKIPTAMPVMARIGLSQRAQVGMLGVPEVVEAVSVVTAYPFRAGCSIVRVNLLSARPQSVSSQHVLEPTGSG